MVTKIGMGMQKTKESILTSLERKENNVVLRKTNFTKKKRNKKKRKKKKSWWRRSPQVWVSVSFVSRLLRANGSREWTCSATRQTKRDWIGVGTTEIDGTTQPRVRQRRERQRETDSLIRAKRNEMEEERESESARKKKRFAWGRKGGRRGNMIVHAWGR